MRTAPFALVPQQHVLQHVDLRMHKNGENVNEPKNVAKSARDLVDLAPNPFTAEVIAGAALVLDARDSPMRQC